MATLHLTVRRPRQRSAAAEVAGAAAAVEDVAVEDDEGRRLGAFLKPRAGAMAASCQESGVGGSFGGGGGGGGGVGGFCSIVLSLFFSAS